MQSLTRRFSLPALLAALLGAAIAILLLSSTGHDDSHITFWPAWTLSELGEIVNHSGDRIEQSSSLLQTLLLALLYHLTHVPLAWLGYISAILAGIFVIWRLPALAREFDWEPSFGALLVMATAPAFAYWQLGMLESTLFTWAGIEFVAAVMRIVGGSATRGTWLRFALWAGALATVRPEAGVVGICVVGAHLVLALLARSRREILAAGVATAIAVAWLVAVMLFRESYFGSPFPRPVAVKVGHSATLSLTKLAEGAGYLVVRFSSAGGALLLVGLVVGIGLGIRDSLRGERRLLTPLLFLLAYLSFILFVGGDWMEGWRFVGHVEPLFFFFLLLGAHTLNPGTAVRRTYTTGLVLTNVVAILGLGAKVGTGRPLWTAWQIDPAVKAYADPEVTWPERANQVHCRDVVAVDDLDFVLNRLLGIQDHVTILSGQAGLMMFYAAKRHFGQITLYDYRGLSSNDFADVEEVLGVTAARIGLDWTIQDVMSYGLAHPDERFQPDVVFEISRTMARHMEKLGYTVVYAQCGVAKGGYESPQEVFLEHAQGEEDQLGFGGEGEDSTPFVPGLRAKSDEDLRARIASRIARRDSFFESETPMFQFIAVRSELAEKAGLVSVSDSVDYLGLQWPASRQYLVWANARRPWQRFFFGNEGVELPPPPPTFKVSPWTGTLVARQATEGLARWKGLQKGRGIYVKSVSLRGRELVEGRDYRIEKNGAFDPLLRILPAAGLGAGDRLVVKGVIRGPEPVEVRGALAAG
ncbi:MAG TPA: hypothetical protein ENJ09_16450 [Planctomycetes bacterium]|nr:hypothetical protein [Planctomycetota bacterium]